jgi:hypothetical protein
MLGLAVGTASAQTQWENSLRDIRLPEGFSISVYAAPVPGARSLTLGERGTVFVGTREQGVVYALRDAENDGRADSVITIARGLDQPNGVAFRDGALYVAEINRVVRFDAIEDHLDDPPRPATVNDGFPSDTAYGWKFIAFGPDGKLYVPVGMPCNVCLPSDERYGSIMRMNADGSGRVRLTDMPLWNQVGPDKQPNWNNVSPRWSPDGSQIAFLTDRTGRWEIWVMNADGSNQRPLFTPEVNAALNFKYDFNDEKVLNWR